MTDQTVELDEIEGVINRIKLRFKFITKSINNTEILNRIGSYLVLKIKDRTQQKSEDVFGNAFKPYTNSYKLFRKKHNRGDKVTLTFFGGMMNSLTYHSSEAAREVKIYFMPGEDRAMPGAKTSVQNPAKAFYIQKKRKFFGVSVKDEEKVREMYRDYIRKALDGRK